MAIIGAKDGAKPRPATRNAFTLRIADSASASGRTYSFEAVSATADAVERPAEADLRADADDRDDGTRARHRRDPDGLIDLPGETDTFTLAGTAGARSASYSADGGLGLFTPV
jgi:hypothetical protein